VELDKGILYTLPLLTYQCLSAVPVPAFGGVVLYAEFTNPFKPMEDRIHVPEIAWDMFQDFRANRTWL
jgi:hypothetical protein